MLAKGHEITIERDLEDALSKYTILFDASPAADIIKLEYVTPETLIAAPGMPLGLTKDAYSVVKEHLIHDVLEIGVATMLAKTGCMGS